MSKKRNILIIENQFSQFEKIFENLGDSYERFPVSKIQEVFVKFIDNARVWVNEKYGEEYRNVAGNYIYTLIESNNIELVIMDHILGGAHHCLTGIDLAFDINLKRTENKKDLLPILFLSKTRFDNKKREAGNNKLKGINSYSDRFGKDNYRWVHKGYFGDEILEPSYFNSAVKTKIEELLSTSEEGRYKIILGEIMTLDFGKDATTKATLEMLYKNEMEATDQIKRNIISIYEKAWNTKRHLIPSEINDLLK